MTLATCAICGHITDRNSLNPSEVGLLCQACSELTAGERERLTLEVLTERDVDPEGL